MLWIRDDRGCVGLGELLRLTFTGPNRFSDASRTWREVARHAEVEDAVHLPGTGLTALGTFAFADESTTESVLIVPRLLVAQHRSAAWKTEFSFADAGTDSGSGSDQATFDDFDPLQPPLAPAKWDGAELSTSVSAARGEDATAAYLTGVREAVTRIERGDVEKVVLARQVTGELPADADLRVPLGRLSERYLNCWTFAVDGLIGSSPETLVRSTGGAVSARVLAGTRSRHSDDHADTRARDALLTSAKEQHEHAFAVQSVVTALAPHVTEMHTSDEPFPLQLPNVWHLSTDLGAHLGGTSSALDLVGALHPTAAVAGTPTASAIAAIAELEPFDRGRYAGAVGWIDHTGDGEWVIALRCAQLEPIGDSVEQGTARNGATRNGAVESETPGNHTVTDEAAAGETAAKASAAAEGIPRRLTASAGGGIVAGSDPEHELAETASKFRPIAEAFS